MILFPLSFFFFFAFIFLHILEKDILRKDVTQPISFTPYPTHSFRNEKFSEKCHTGTTSQYDLE